MENNKTRNEVIDIAKGIGIILVVWAHSSGPFSNWINSFHMPFFFLISGVLFNTENSIKTFCKKKFVGLYIPFLGWNLIWYPVFFILFYWNNWQMNIAVSDIVQIILTLYKVPFLGATWFLGSLFVVSIVYKIFYTKLGKYNILILLVLIAVGLILGFTYTFPYRMSRTLICSSFYGLGCIIKLKAKSIRNIEKPLLCIPISLIIIAANLKINVISLPENIFRYKILFLLSAIASSYLLIKASQFLAKIKFQRLKSQIILFGIRSKDIVIWQFLAFRLVIIIQIFCMKGELSLLTAFPTYITKNGWWILYVIAGIYGSLLWVYILRHSPFGKKIEKIHLI